MYNDASSYFLTSLTYNFMQLCRGSYVYRLLKTLEGMKLYGPHDIRGSLNMCCNKGRVEAIEFSRFISVILNKFKPI